MIALHRDQAVIDACALVIAELQELTPSLVFASVITSDGFEITHAPANSFNSERLASMTSSVQALGDAVARELAMGSNGYVVMALDGGNLLQIRVPGQRVILAALFNNQELLGKGLAVSRRAVDRLGALLAAL